MLQSIGHQLPLRSQLALSEGGLAVEGVFLLPQTLAYGAIEVIVVLEKEETTENLMSSWINEEREARKRCL